MNGVNRPLCNNTYLLDLAETRAEKISFLGGMHRRKMHASLAGKPTFILFVEKDTTTKLQP